MSGGHYDYDCFRIDELANELRRDIIVGNWKEDADTDKEIEIALREAYAIIKRAGAVSYAVEWFMSGDYGSDTFLKEFNSIMKKDYSLKSLE